MGWGRQFRQSREVSNTLDGRAHADSLCWFPLAVISRSSLRMAQPLVQIWKDWDFERGSLLGHRVIRMDPGADPPAVLPFMTCADILGLEVSQVWASCFSD